MQESISSPGTCHAAHEQRCPHCGGSDIIVGACVIQNAEVGTIGLAYKKSIFTTAEQLHADLCKSCGTVVRLFVKNADRKWVQK
jgi:hypothetical protein